jgi:hypothetical protein
MIIYKVPEHQPAIEFGSTDTLFPVALTVQNDVTSFEFNFFEFRDFIEYKVDFATVNFISFYSKNIFSLLIYPNLTLLILIKQLPTGVYCEGDIPKSRPLLNLYDEFSFVDETIFNHVSGTTTRVAYSQKIKAVRIDALTSKDNGPVYIDKPVKVHLKIFL